MRLKFTLALLGIALSGFSQDGAPASPYYNGFNFSQTGTSLKNALAQKIINTHTNNLSYSEVWDALKQTDLDPSNSSKVMLLYGWEAGTDGDQTNDLTRNKNNNGGNNGDWNREHTFVQSAGNPDLGSTGPGADAHHLRACDVQRNGNRANQKFASGSGIASGNSGGGWYPGDQWKGDVARMIMYMYLRYGSQCLPTYVGMGATAGTDGNLPQIFLQWNAEDPVSQYEDNRNTYLGNSSNAYGQGNRNPFIDNPYLATLIWGGPVAQNRWPFLSTESYDWTQTVSVFPNPTYGEINISSETEIEQIQIFSVNGQLIQSVSNPQFSNHTYRIDNLPKGFYLLKMSNDGSEITKKIIVN